MVIAPGNLSSTEVINNKGCFIVLLLDILFKSLTCLKGVLIIGASWKLLMDLC